MEVGILQLATKLFLKGRHQEVACDDDCLNACAFVFCGIAEKEG